jgi:CBS domain-containing protein
MSRHAIPPVRRPQRPPPAPSATARGCTADVEPVPLLAADQDLRTAARQLVGARVPALPVVDSAGRYVGILSERDVIRRIFPSYLEQLRHAAFVPDSLDEALERSPHWGAQPVHRFMDRRPIEIPPGCSEAQLAALFLNNGVEIVPVVDRGELKGVVTRTAFLAALVERSSS